MRKRIIRFPLKLKEDAEVRSLEELRENFDIEKIVKYFSDGSLERWLEVWMFADEAEKVRALTKDDKSIGRKLCEIFGVVLSEETVDIENIAWRTERENRLKQYTGDEEILAKVDFVAFDSQDLCNVLEEADTNTIYLCNNSFAFNSGVLKHRNKCYIGIGNVEVVIESKESVLFDELGISFVNVKIDEAYTKKKNCRVMDSSEPANEELPDNKNVWSAVKMIDDRFHNYVFGKRVSEEITADNGLAIVKSGDYVTDEIIQEVKLVTAQ